MANTRRAMVAALVSAVGSVVGIAGMGHAYLREWRRAVAWFALVLGAGMALVVAFSNPQAVTPTTLPREVTLPLITLFALNTFDAYYVAVRTPVGREAADDVCPTCGQEADPTLDFCPWCAEEFDE